MERQTTISPEVYMDDGGYLALLEGVGYVYSLTYFSELEGNVTTLFGDASLRSVVGSMYTYIGLLEE